MTGQLLDPTPPKLIRLASPKAKEMIAELRRSISGSADLIDMFHRICDILDELNEQEMSRGRSQSQTQE